MKLLFLQVECEQAVVAGTSQEQLALVDADALAIGQVGVFPGTGLLEIFVVSKQSVARRDKDRITIDRKAAKTTLAFLTIPFDIWKIVFYGVENGLVGNVDNVSAAVDFTLGGAVYYRCRQQLWRGVVYRLIPEFPVLETDRPWPVEGFVIPAPVSSEPIRDIAAAALPAHDFLIEQVTDDQVQ